jgi:hypothetical protein
MAVIDNLVAYWSLDEASGNAIDAHAAYDLTETSGTIASTTGKVGNARDFESGDTEHFRIADTADLRIADKAITIAGWVNAESFGANRDIFSKFETTTGGVAEYLFAYQNSPARFRFVVYDAAAGTTATQATADNFGAPSTATWYFIVAWHDPTADQIAICVNDGTPDTAAHAGGVRVSAAPLLMGARWNGTSETLHWDGLIDEFGFWNKVLSASEITWLYNSGNGRSYADIVAEAGGSTPGARRRRLLAA